MSFRRLFTITMLAIFGIAARADVTVSSSGQLAQVLAQDKDLGNIYLTAPQYTVDVTEVKAGGTLCPMGGGRVTLTGTHHSVQTNALGISTRPITDYKPGISLITDAQLRELPINQPSVVLPPTALEEVDKETMTVRIKCDDALMRLVKDLTDEQLVNCQGRLAMWYQCAVLSNLRYADGYLYGTFSQAQYYNNVAYTRKNTPSITLCLYNLPSDGATYVDARGYLHSQRPGETLMYFPLSSSLKPSGKRPLEIRNIDFVGFGTAVSLAKFSLSKTLSNCTFAYCKGGVMVDNASNNRPTSLTVSDCAFHDMYGSTCVRAWGSDNTTVTGCTFDRTGLVDKSGSVIDLSGANFLVKGNTLRSFSYIGIRIGQTRTYGTMDNIGLVEGNLLDNADIYGDPSKSLNDGGAIYIFTDQTNTVVRGNVVCNIGYPGALGGIFLDDGAYNTTVTGNLVFNINDSYTIDSREVKKYERHNGNNTFTNNVLIGKVKIYGPTSPLMAKATFTGNYVDGSENIGKDNVVIKDNTQIQATTTTQRVTVNKQTYKKIKKKLSSFVMRYIAK